MNIQSDAVPNCPVDSQAVAPAALSATRPMYWSVRRELWENRSIYIAPLVVLPLLAFAVAVATQLIMLLLTAAVLLGNGLSAAPLWTQLTFFQSSLALLYGLAVVALWQAPTYGWLLLISAWARRATFL